MSNTLYTFPPANNCEFIRWMLQYYGVEYKEVQNAPPFFIGTMIRYLSPQTAILVKDNGQVFKNVLSLINKLDQEADKDKSLIDIPSYNKIDIER